MLATWGHRTDDKTGDKRAVIVWETATGKERFRLAAEGNEILAAAFSPDGSTLAVGGTGQRVHRWDVRTGVKQPSLSGYGGDIRALAFSACGRMLAGGGEGTTILVWAINEKPRKPARLLGDGPPDAKQLLYRDLAGMDAARAFQAMRTLHADPASCVALLREHLRPATVTDAETIRRAIADLDSDDFAVRTKALGELTRRGDRIEPLLRRVLRGHPSLEVRKQVEGLLDQFAVDTPERLRHRRVLEVLEWLDTEEARRLVDALASGAADAWLTSEAKKIQARRAVNASVPSPISPPPSPSSANRPAPSAAASPTRDAGR
jgi:WD40 repeat protein